MLHQLRIAGLALLQDCTLEFSPGLTVISGETGAGKTMVLTSLRLLMGGRAEPSIVKTGSKMTEVDGTVEVEPQIADALEEMGYAVEDGAAYFSRTVIKEGRSRAAISGRPVPAKTLADILGPMITIHGQADQFRLKGAFAQLELLDTYAGPKHRQILENYRKIWQQTVRLRNHLKEIEENYDRLTVELRYLSETVEQIEALNPGENEEEELDSNIERLTNVEELRDFTTHALASLQGEQTLGAADQLGRAVDYLRRAARFDTSLLPFENRATELEIESQALSADLAHYVDGLTDDPGELARLHERRASLTELMRGRATSAKELIDWLQKAKSRISELSSDASDPDAVRKELESNELSLAANADQVTASRRKAADKLSELVTKELKALSLGDAQFSVQIEPVTPAALGADKVTMMLRPHKSAPETPIAQGASGGELSRIMLALEVVLAAEDHGKTFVFDEIDAGIGGKTAISVGQRLQRLAEDQQVIVVTHQPQIAALADRNLVVTKHDGVATVRPVFGEDRTAEIVRMLGGDDAQGAARRHALELEKRSRVE